MGWSGYGSFLKATWQSSLERKVGRLTPGGSRSEGATIESSERRKAMIEARSSSERWGSFTIHGGAYWPSRLTPVRRR